METCRSASAFQCRSAIRASDVRASEESDVFTLFHGAGCSGKLMLRAFPGLLASVGAHEVEKTDCLDVIGRNHASGALVFNR